MVARSWRLTDHFDRLRTFAIPDTGIVRITSEDEGTMMTELILANLLHDRGRRISIDTRSESSALVGEGRAAAWVHLRRKD